MAELVVNTKLVKVSNKLVVELLAMTVPETLFPPMVELKTCE